MKKTLLILISAISLSCTLRNSTKKTSNQSPELRKIRKALHNAVEAKDFLLKAVKTHRVVFLSESHNIVNPILFLAQNIERLYREGGLRHLFLEISIPPEKVRLNTGWLNESLGNPPCRGVAERFEWVHLFRAIRRINSNVPRKDRLQLHYAEKGFKFDLNSPRTLKNNILRARDRYAFNTVMKTIRATPKKEKILIFYGGFHGNKKPLQTPSKFYNHHSLGALLYKSIGKNYYAINFYYYDFGSAKNPLQREKNRIFRKTGLTVSALPVQGTPFDTKFAGHKSSYFTDAKFFIKSPRFGIPAGYIRNTATVRQLINSLKNWYILSRMGKAQHFDRDNFGVSCYLLGIHLGNIFHYSLYNPKQLILKAIHNLEKWLPKNRIRPATTREIVRLGKFCQLVNYQTRRWKDREARYRKGFRMFPQELNTFIYALRNTKQITRNQLMFALQHKNARNCRFLLTLTNRIPTLQKKGDPQNILPILRRLKRWKQEIIRPYSDKHKGVYVYTVPQKSPATGKLRFGDLVQKIGTQVVLDSNHLKTGIRRNINKPTTVRFMREGKMKTIRITFRSSGDIVPFVMPDDIFKR